LRQQSPPGLRVQIVDNRQESGNNDSESQQQQAATSARLEHTPVAQQSMSRIEHGDQCVTQETGQFGTVEIVNKKNTTCSIKHRIDATAGPESSDNSGSDEDVLHVVTNVYTIPINNHTKPLIANNSMSNATSEGNHQHDDCLSASSSVGVRISNCPNSSMLYQPVPIVHNGSSSRSGEATTTTTTGKDSCHVFQRIINCGDQLPQPDLAKSKFQIRSIVEIYESDAPPPVAAAHHCNAQAGQDLGFYKTSTQVNETTTKEYITVPLKAKGKQEARPCVL
jgi:hypothetical protein